MGAGAPDSSAASMSARPHEQFLHALPVGAHQKRVRARERESERERASERERERERMRERNGAKDVPGRGSNKADNYWNPQLKTW